LRIGRSGFAARRVGDGGNGSNALTDYLSLFVIRPLLIRISLALDAVSGAGIVLAARLVRILVFADPLTFAQLLGEPSSALCGWPEERVM